MENSEDATPVRGLIDGRIMAEMTGQSLPNTRFWVSRQAAGKGFPERRPTPVGRLNGGAVWAAQDLDVELARSSVKSVPARGPKPKKVGSSDETEHLLSSPANASRLLASVDQHWATSDRKSNATEASDD